MLHHDAQVEVLDLSENDLTLSQLKLLATALRRNRHLKELILDGNRLGNLGAGEMAALISMNRQGVGLRRLSLNRCDISYHGARILIEAIHYDNRMEMTLALNENPLTEHDRDVLIHAARDDEEAVHSRISNAAANQQMAGDDVHGRYVWQTSKITLEIENPNHNLWGTEVQELKLEL